jgi:hypothetical protein
LVKEKEKLMNKNNKQNFNYTGDKITSKIKFKNRKDITEYDKEIINQDEENLEVDFKEQLNKKQKIYEALSSKNKNFDVVEIDENNYQNLKEISLVDFDFKKIEEKIKNKSFKDKSIIKIYDNLKPDNFDKERTIVKQSYDKKLTNDEKQALDSIIKEEKDYKLKLEILKRKKNLEREERIEKIKKMSIGENNKIEI